MSDNQPNIDALASKYGARVSDASKTDSIAQKYGAQYFDADGNKVAAQVKMTAPNGNSVTVDRPKVDEMRKQNYAVSADNPGAVRMATPQGQLTYALPGEVESFKASGHVPI